MSRLMRAERGNWERGGPARQHLNHVTVLTRGQRGFTPEWIDRNRRERVNAQTGGDTGVRDETNL